MSKLWKQTKDKLKEYDPFVPTLQDLLTVKNYQYNNASGGLIFLVTQVLFFIIAYNHAYQMFFRKDPTITREIKTFPNDSKNYSISLLPMFMMQFAEYPYIDIPYDDDFKSYIKIQFGVRNSFGLKKYKSGKHRHVIKEVYEAV